MPGISSAVAAHERAVGIDVSTSLPMVVCRRMLCTSTIGVTPDTVIVSVTPPTVISASICAVNAPVSSIPSRFTWLKPGSAKVTVYVPGGKRDDAEQAAVVGHCRADLLDEHRARGFDGDSGQRGSGCVLRRTGDGCLRERGGRQKGRECNEEHSPQERAH